MKILYPVIILSIINVCACRQIEENTAVDDIFSEWNRPDVPGYQESEGYALFKFDDGLSY